MQHKEHKDHCTEDTGTTQLCLCVAVLEQLAHVKYEELEVFAYQLRRSNSLGDYVVILPMHGHLVGALAFVGSRKLGIEFTMVTERCKCIQGQGIFRGRSVRREQAMSFPRIALILLGRSPHCVYVIQQNQTSIHLLNLLTLTLDLCLLPVRLALLLPQAFRLG